MIEVCPKCQTPLREQPERPFPVLLQTLFGVSFLAFLIVFEKIKAHPFMIWLWCALQIVLGVALLKARIRARRRIYRCIRCEQALP